MQSGKADELCARALCEKTSKNSWHAEPRELAREDERRQSDDAAEPAAYREREMHNGPFCFENFPLCLHHHRSSVNNIAPWLVLNTHWLHCSRDIIENSGQATLFVIIHLHKKPLMTLSLKQLVPRVLRHQLKGLIFC